ncbi:MAG: hypothetical protein US30_C0002G0007 [Candidatus Moranbacteria bacterium GW2011_GWF2_36_839]|nr:MAG: hypothetical protein US27_C0003G0007 [Candidatus Moranbacteria bacterium GW2011_GWF1_36_78]KKQ17547.1 MAG: hypothetical protein US30_C0002G0007 [Candidatus Moranbacteria bacterium GW2011_GWF2_36_839]HAT74272.1 hypothetical protein [Candidatus Moranbacteria bacterium]HBY10949.1 hypothetical protein [Candidatus Moranbacteria bacterium]
MSLQDIKNNLYKKDAPENLSDHEISKYDPSLAKDTGEMKKGESDLWAKKTGLDKAEKKAIKKGVIAGAIVIGIIILMAVFMLVRQMLFQSGNATIEISGPMQVNSGKLLTYEINYKNDNRLTINNAVIKINYPENFKPENNPNFKSDNLTSGSFNIGTIKGKTQGKIVLNGKAYSPKGALIYLKASMSYNPAGYSSQFQANYQLGVTVNSAPITLEVLAPQNASSGDAVDYQINYRNDGGETIDGLVIKIKYPDQFTFSSASPKTSTDNNTWDIGNLSAGQSGKIVVSGKLEGERDNIKTVSAEIGVSNQNEFVAYNSESAETKMIFSPLTIAQRVNKKDNLVVNAGDTLEFEIAYKNNGNVGLRDVIITEEIDSALLDYSSLRLKNGSFDINKKIITWKASDISELVNLGANQSGMLNFTVKVSNTFPVGEEKDKNFIIHSVAKIDSPDVPTPISMNKIISSNEINMKVNSKVAVSVKGYYADKSIPNFGPIPPKVGQETTYTIHWKALNISNDVSGAKVVATLPTNAQMTGKIFPEGANLNYNSRTNEMVWTIGNMKSGTGLLLPSPEVAFQVKITPSPDQVGREVGLLEKTNIFAKDLFTGEDIKGEYEAKNTNLTEDSSIVGGNRVEG